MCKNSAFIFCVYPNCCSDAAWLESGMQSWVFKLRTEHKHKLFIILSVCIPTFFIPCILNKFSKNVVGTAACAKARPNKEQLSGLCRAGARAPQMHHPQWEYSHAESVSTAEPGQAVGLSLSRAQNVQTGLWTEVWELSVQRRRFYVSPPESQRDHMFSSSRAIFIFLLDNHNLLMMKRCLTWCEMLLPMLGVKKWKLHGCDLRPVPRLSCVRRHSFPHGQRALAPSARLLKPSHSEENWNGISHLGASLGALVETWKHTA